MQEIKSLEFLRTLYKKDLFSFLTLIILVLLLFIGGTGKIYDVIVPLGTICFIVILLVAKNTGKEMNLPKNFYLYFLFLAASSVGVIYSVDRFATLKQLLLFFSGGLLLTITYIFKEIIRPLFNRLILSLGLFYLLLYILYFFIGYTRGDSLSLFISDGSSYIHNHLGDLWAIVLIVIFSLFPKKIKSLDILIFLTGLIIVYLSHSRSAYLALFCGILFLLFKRGDFRKNKIWFITIYLLFLILNSFSAVTKPIITSRPYFFQSIAALPDYPFGIGMGNFGRISEIPKYEVTGHYFSILTHNILLEALIGGGVLGLFFLLWFLKILLSIYRVKNAQVYPVAAVVLGLSINFLFDFTYVIPTMLWLWFMSLGLFED